MLMLKSCLDYGEHCADGSMTLAMMTMTLNILLQAEINKSSNSHGTRYQFDRAIMTIRHVLMTSMDEIDNFLLCHEFWQNLRSDRNFIIGLWQNILIPATNIELANKICKILVRNIIFYII